MLPLEIAQVGRRRRKALALEALEAVELSDKNFQQLWVPRGFAHGFSVLEDNTIFQYKCTKYYNKSSEGGLYYNDPELGLNWKVESPIVSEKDLMLPNLKDFNSPFD